MKISASFANRISAAVSQLYGSVGADVPTRLEASTSRILASATKGFFLSILDRVLSDNVAAAEDVALAYFKNISENVTVDEAILIEGVAAHFVKSLADAGAAADISDWNLGKFLTDDAGFTDDEHFDVGKTVSDQAFLLDQLFVMHFHKELSDTLLVGDNVAYGLTKIFDELPSVADVFEYVVGPSFADAFLASDSTVLAAGKLLSDSGIFGDAYVSAYAKILTDAFGAADLYSGEVGKSFNETPAVTDVVAKTAAFFRSHTDTSNAVDTYNQSFGSFLSDTPFVSETTSSAFSKAFADSALVADVFDRTSTSLARDFSETVTVTDDVDGSASILDDQEMHFATQRTHIASATDVFASMREYYRVFSDTGGANDDARDIFVGKSLAETPATSDAATMSFSSFLLDAPSVSDIFAKSTSLQHIHTAEVTDLFSSVAQFSRAFSDAGGANDGAYSLSLEKPFSDAGGANDGAYSLSVGKLFSDTSGANDGTLDLSTGKVLAETPSATDIFAKSSSVGLADSALSADAVIVVPNKVVLETASLTDAGSLRSQGYADFAYFSEDYVGASRTF